VFKSTQKWENPLMGWTSSADPMSTIGQMQMKFKTKEQAVAFATAQGWKYEVKEPKPMVTGRRTKAYADNFSVKRHGIPVNPWDKQ